MDHVDHQKKMAHADHQEKMDHVDRQKMLDHVHTEVYCLLGYHDCADHDCSDQTTKNPGSQQEDN